MEILCWALISQHKSEFIQFNLKLPLFQDTRNTFTYICNFRLSIIVYITIFFKAKRSGFFDAFV